MTRTEYAAYLESADWQQRRTAKLTATGHRCERCHAIGVRLEVHHTAGAYHLIPHEPLETLRVLCWRCHRIEHGLPVDEARDMVERLEWLETHALPATVANLTPAAARAEATDLLSHPKETPMFKRDPADVPQAIQSLQAQRLMERLPQLPPPGTLAKLAERLATMQPRRYLAFDLEIAKVVPDGEPDWKQHRPLGISCAATWASDEAGPTWWSDTHGSPKLTREGAIELVHSLDRAVREDGYTLLTHNGAGFDFDILAEESGLHADCVALALNSVDTMLHFFCLKGFGVGLDAIAKGMGLPGKVAGMNGALAPQLWAEGRRTEVLEYVAQDVRTTLDVALAVEKAGGICWVTRGGATNGFPLPGGWLTVREALALPLPNVTWMTAPWPRSKFIGWMELDARAEAE